MKTIIPMAALLLLPAAFAQAQAAAESAPVSYQARHYKNSFQFGVGRFYCNALAYYGQDRLERMGFTGYQLSYARNLDKKWSLSVSYQSYLKPSEPLRAMKMSTLEFNYNDKNPHGQVASRWNWQFVDINFAYRFRIKKHVISARLGPSWSQTDNSYIVYNYYNGGCIWYSEYTWGREQYIGLSGGIQYDYYLLKDHLSIGGNFTYKRYDKMPYAYRFFMLHTAVHF